MLVSHAGIVFPHTGYCNVSLAFVEALCSNRIRRQEEEDDERPQHCYGASEKVPRNICQLQFDVLREAMFLHVLPAVQAPTLDMSKAIVNQRRNSRSVRSCAVPRAHSQCLLALLIPPTHNQHKHWRNARFQKPEEEALRVEALPVRTCGRTHETNTPDEQNAGCNALDRPTLRHDNRRVTSYDKPKVEDGG